MALSKKALQKKREKKSKKRQVKHNNEKALLHTSISVNDFSEKNSAWLVFRVDSFIKSGPIDIYMMLMMPANQLVASLAIETELSDKQAHELLLKGFNSAFVPKRVLLTTGDPAEAPLRLEATKMGLEFETVSSRYMNKFVAAAKKSFSENCGSSSAIEFGEPDEFDSQQDLQHAQQLIPDSYDLCPCASGKKYKYCCKRIFIEVTEAMTAFEEGDVSEALRWMKKAKKIVGETAEILCRKAIIYTSTDPEKSQAMLKKCLKINPRHPRAHYVIGLDSKLKGDYQAAIEAYEIAIANYPETDHYHLNETYNNLGVVYHELDDLDKAKLYWEKALLYSPQDEVVKRNLQEFIYGNERFQGVG